ncbi:MAG: hypothetical protein KAJ48_07565, partial [Elusimicrobiales bacterium]|nr:hypothetical protein [Elusimicrobiales bacterium]
MKKIILFVMTVVFSGAAFASEIENLKSQPFNVKMTPVFEASSADTSIIPHSKTMDADELKKASELLIETTSADVPLVCFEKAKEKYGYDRAIDLCSGASSAEAPLACFEKA